MALNKIIIGAAIAGGLIYLLKLGKQPATEKTAISDALKPIIDMFDNSYLAAPQP